MNWRTGEFDRSLVPEIFHRFVPAHAVNTLVDIDLKKLWDGGKRLIMLDVDHTIVKWKAEEFAEPVLQWIAEAKKLGFDLCIISNTRRPARLGRLSKILEIETVKGKFKPSAEMFHLALAKFNRKPEEAVMIGDQMMTDILGANRAGINAIWVKKMDGKEFVGTKVNRFVERILRSVIYKALITPVDEEADPAAVEQTKPVAERTLVKQIIRFCIVGGTSFIIDVGLTFFFMRGITIHGTALSIVLGDWLRATAPGLFSFSKDAAGASAPILGGCASLVAMYNSFVWNRAWTFEQKGSAEKLAHLRRFYAVSITGAVWNTIIFSAFVNIIPGHVNRSIAIAKVIAAFIVAIWNFLGQRYYAFRSTSHAK
jgi:uncharacterized protein